MCGFIPLIILNLESVYHRSMSIGSGPFDNNRRWWERSRNLGRSLWANYLALLFFSNLMMMSFKRAISIKLLFCWRERRVPWTLRCGAADIHGREGEGGAKKVNVCATAGETTTTTTQTRRGKRKKIEIHSNENWLCNAHKQTALTPVSSYLDIHILSLLRVFWDIAWNLRWKKSFR